MLPTLARPPPVAPDHPKTRTRTRAPNNTVQEDTTMHYRDQATTVATTYAQTVSDAENYFDPDLNPDALARIRQEKAQAAHTRAKASAEQLRDSAQNSVNVASNAAKHPGADNTNAVAVKARWDGLRELIEAGRELTEVVATADADDLDALAEHGPTFIRLIAHQEGLARDAEASRVADLRLAIDQRAGIIGAGKGMAELATAYADQAFVESIAEWITKTADRGSRERVVGIELELASALSQAEHRAGLLEPESGRVVGDSLGVAHIGNQAKAPSVKEMAKDESVPMHLRIGAALAVALDDKPESTTA